MDWSYKAVLTATLVAAVMMAARLFGRRLAGLLAGLPVISAPALLWLAHEQGAAFAAASAVGSLAACAAAPLFAWGFERTARRRGAGASLGAATLLLVLGLLAAQPLQGRPGLALVAALAVCLAVQRALARRVVVASWVRPLRGEPWISAVLAGVVVAVVTRGAHELGPFWSGVATTLPVISACALVHLRLAGSPGEVTGFVSGYVPGVAAKAVFLFVFASTAPLLEAGWALLAALAAGVAAARVMLPAKRADASARASALIAESTAPRGAP